MKILLFNKPFQTLCQFSPHEQKRTLKAFIDEPGYYPCGRLDYDSEGLLLLSDHGPLQALISEPRHKMAKVYWVQVEGRISATALAQLEQGVTLKDGLTQPAQAREIPHPNPLWERHPPIRERRDIPTSWIEITLKEGKNRQVRRMTAATGFPTLRLIRAAIGPFQLASLQPGEWCFTSVPSDLLKRLQRPTKNTNRFRKRNQRPR